MNRNLLLFLLLMIPIIGISQNTSQQSISSIIVGTWEFDDDGELYLHDRTYTFNADGTGIMQIAEHESYNLLIGAYIEPAKDYNFSWSLKQNTLTILIQFKKEEQEVFSNLCVANHNEITGNCIYSSDEIYPISFIRVDDGSEELYNMNHQEYSFPEFMTEKGYSHVYIESLI